MYSEIFVLHLIFSFALWPVLRRHHYCFAELGTFTWHTCICCKVPPRLLLHSVVCLLPFHTAWGKPYFKTNDKLCHGQGVLQGIVIDDEHEFVYGVGVTLSIQVSLFFSSYWVISCNCCFKDCIRSYTACLTISPTAIHAGRDTYTRRLAHGPPPQSVPPLSPTHVPSICTSVSNSFLFLVGFFMFFSRLTAYSDWSSTRALWGAAILL
jgi:hypothetical protein